MCCDAKCCIQTMAPDFFFNVFGKGFLSHHLTLRGLVAASLDNRSSLSPARSYQVRSGVREMPTRTAQG